MCYLYVSGETRRNRVENECVLQWYPQIYVAFIRMAKAALQYFVSGLPLCKCMRNVEWGRTCIMMPHGCWVIDPTLIDDSGILNTKENDLIYIRLFWSKQSMRVKSQNMYKWKVRRSWKKGKIRKFMMRWGRPRESTWYGTNEIFRNRVIENKT